MDYRLDWFLNVMIYFRPAWELYGNSVHADSRTLASNNHTYEERVFKAICKFLSRSGILTLKNLTNSLLKVISEKHRFILRWVRLTVTGRKTLHDGFPSRRDEIWNRISLSSHPFLARISILQGRQMDSVDRRGEIVYRTASIPLLC
jgi:hypothetical protein